MRLLNRTAVIVKPKQPYIEWANSLDDDGVKLDPNSIPEHTIYLIDDKADYLPDNVEMIKPYFAAIFEEELNGWHRVESDWPSPRDLSTFLAWFEIEIHSMILDLHPGWLKRERYE